MANWNVQSKNYWFCDYEQQEIVLREIWFEQEAHWLATWLCKETFGEVFFKEKRWEWRKKNIEHIYNYVDTNIDSPNLVPHQYVEAKNSQRLLSGNKIQANATVLILSQT